MHSGKRTPNSGLTGQTCRTHPGRAGWSRWDVFLALGALLVISAIAIPAVSSVRESARRSQCAWNLKILTQGLLQYHDSHKCLPPAAIWKPGQLKSLMLDQNRRIDLFTHQNWAQLVLPHIGRTDIANLFAPGRPVAAAENESARTLALKEMTCPSDHFNEPENHYRFERRPDDPDPIIFARGNYSINGGTHAHRTRPGATSRPRGDGFELIIDEKRRTVRHIGNGIAGINQTFSLSDFVNGQSTLVALEEVRSGIHPLDPRGVWSLGQIGGSLNWGNGVTGDDGGPNNQDKRADDVLGCGRLHQILGKEALMEARMPCVHYIDRNDQATARSLHVAGVNVSFMDGAVRFVNDRVDSGLWHVMHSRETPTEVLAEVFEERLNTLQPPPDRQPAESGGPPPTVKPGTVFANSLAMTFVSLPAGEFQMGVADIGNDFEPPPPECPTHLVKITRPIWIGQYEVTQESFQQVMGSNPSHHRPAPGQAGSFAKFPVEQVTWFEAEKFCTRLSALPAERTAKRHYRLPTEAEWEYACRAGSSKAYEPPGSQDQARNGENGGLDQALPITAVGSYAPNAFQLYDMRGNVWEWCADWYDRAYYSRSPTDDPQGPATGYLKVLRGNDWIFTGEACRISAPMMLPWKSNPFVGFRVVCEIHD